MVDIALGGAGVSFIEKQNRLISQEEDLQERLLKAQALAKETGNSRPVKEVERRLANLQKKKKHFYNLK